MKQTLAAFLILWSLANAGEQIPEGLAGPEREEYGKILESSQRPKILSTNDFVNIPKDRTSIILDTRDKKDYDRIHVTSAVNLPFGQFSRKSLADLIPDKNTSINLYEPNNLRASASTPVQLAGPSWYFQVYAVLRIYGYTHISALDPEVHLPSTPIQLTEPAKTTTDQVKGQQTQPAVVPAPSAEPQVSDLIWNRDLKTGSALPVHTIQTIEQHNGLFDFNLLLLNNGQRVLGIYGRNPGPDLHPRSIVALSKALDTFLNAVTGKGIDLVNTRSIWMTTIPLEVQKRIADQFLVTKAWWKDPVAHLDDAIAKSNPYREIDEVMRKHKLRISRCCACERTETRKMAVPGNPSVKVNIPVAWGGTSISLESE